MVSLHYIVGPAQIENHSVLQDITNLEVKRAVTVLMVELVQLYLSLFHYKKYGMNINFLFLLSILIGQSLNFVSAYTDTTG